MVLRTQPCGLPVDVFSFDDVLLLDVTICFLLVRKLYAQLMILGFILVAASLSMYEYEIPSQGVECKHNSIFSGPVLAVGELVWIF